MKINRLKLKAMRQSLGLSVAEACEFIPNSHGEPVSKRYFQYLEAGERAIPDDIDFIFFKKSSHYTLLLRLLNQDIEQFSRDSSRSISNNTDDYSEMECVPKLALPFFYSFDDFSKYTGNTSRAYWKIWQAVIGHLILIGKLDTLDDTVRIPDDFTCVRWLNGNYDGK